MNRSKHVLIREGKGCRNKVEAVKKNSANLGQSPGSSLRNIYNIFEFFFRN